MPYTVNVQLMKNMCQSAPVTRIHANQYIPSAQYPHLKLLYPGKRNNYGDYKMEYYNVPFFHTDIIRAIHAFTLSSTGNGKFMAYFLTDIFLAGLNASHNSNHQITIKNMTMDMDEFKHLIYWTVLQEDINFPRPRRNGIKMPFWRYIESIASAEQPHLLSLNQVITRTNNHGSPPPPPFSHPNLKPYLVYCLDQIK